MWNCCVSLLRCGLRVIALLLLRYLFYIEVSGYEINGSINCFSFTVHVSGLSFWMWNVWDYSWTHWLCSDVHIIACGAELPGTTYLKRALFIFLITLLPKLTWLISAHLWSTALFLYTLFVMWMCPLDRGNIATTLRPSALHGWVTPWGFAVSCFNRFHSAACYIREGHAVSLTGG